MKGRRGRCCLNANKEEKERRNGRLHTEELAVGKLI